MNDFMQTRCEKCEKWHPIALSCVTIALQEETREAFDEWLYSTYTKMKRSEMYNLNDVLNGLMNGKSYKCEDDKGVDYLRPARFGTATHTYVSNNGGGGEAEVAWEAISSDLWPNEGWVEI